MKVRMLVVLVLLVTTTVIFGQSDPPKTELLTQEAPVTLKRLEMLTSEHRVVPFESRLLRVESRNPEVLRVTPRNTNELAVTALRVGETEISATDEDGKTRLVKVTVQQDTRQLQATLRKLYPSLKLEIVPLVNDAIVIRGNVPGDREKEQIGEICETFVANVLNHVSVGQPTRLGAVSIPKGKRLVSVTLDEVARDPRALTSNAIGGALVPGATVSVQSKGAETIAKDARVYAVETRTDNKSGVVSLMMTPRQTDRVIKESNKVWLHRVEPVRPAAAKHEDLERQIRDLHRDVKRLIQLLEERQAVRPIEGAVVPIQNKGPVMLSFTADWCAPCRAMQPQIDAMVRDGLPVQQIDIEEEPEAVARYRIKGTPTFLLIQDGKEAMRLTGASNLEPIRRFLTNSEKPIEPIRQEEPIQPIRQEEPIQPIRQEEPIQPLEPTDPPEPTDPEEN